MSVQHESAMDTLGVSVTASCRGWGVYDGITLREDELGVGVRWASSA